MRVGKTVLGETSDLQDLCLLSELTPVHIQNLKTDASRLALFLLFKITINSPHVIIVLT